LKVTPEVRTFPEKTYVSTPATANIVFAVMVA